ncbi:MAG: T9SS type A sorting domain-containing protein [Ignavibacteria bacterium]|nr:T9SS type A sorting domain-containing protein [Ignavibacteria bacterium]
MRPLHSLIMIACLVIFCATALFAQGIETIGGPYTADAYTVLLLHFDGNYSNAAAALGKTAANAVPHSTNPAKIYFLPNTGVAGMGQCVRIDNSSINDSSYITVDDTAAFDMTGSWTIEAWVNIFTFGATSADYRWVPRAVMKPGDDVFYLPNYWLEMWGDNRLFHAGFYTTGGQWISLSSPNNMFVPGEWVHLTFIRDTARAFIACMVHDKDKNLKGFITKGFDKTKDIPLTNRQKVHIGWAGAVGIATASTDSWLDGFVDEVRISNVVRNFAGPPVISNVTVLPNQPSTLPSYPITLTVFPLNAGGRITSAILYFRTESVGSFTGYGMTPSGTNQFTASIPGQAFGKKIQYYVKCTDDNGLSSLSPTDAEAATNPTYYSFLIYQPNAKTLDLTFEEGPGKTPVDQSPNKAKIKTHKYVEYSTDRPTGGGQYSWLLQSHPGVVVDSNWVEAESPFLAAEEFTLDVWVKADSADLHATRIIINPSSEQDWNNANFELSFRNGPPTNKPVFTARYWWEGGGPATLQDSLRASVVHGGKWRHVVLERNKANGAFAMSIRDENDNLMFKKSITESRAPRMAGAPLRIGRSWFLADNNWYVAPFRGKIDNVKLYNYPAAGLTTGISDEDGSEIPWAFDLEQNYPNPFNPTTQIRFTIPKFQQVSLIIYDLLGRQVKTLVNEERHAGQHKVTWDATNDKGVPVATGVYFYQLRAGDLTKTQKLLLIR